MPIWKKLRGLKLPNDVSQDLRKKEWIKLKSNRSQEIIKIRAEINGDWRNIRDQWDSRFLEKKKMGKTLVKPTEWIKFKKIIETKRQYCNRQHRIPEDY